MSINEFLSSTDEELMTLNHDGIFLIVPVSKKDKIASFKFVSQLYSPRVSLLNLDLELSSVNNISDSDEEPDCQQSYEVLKKQETSRIQRKKLFLANETSPQIDLSQIFSTNISLPNTLKDDSLSDMDISGELPSIKLEPKVLIDENDSNASNQSNKKPTDSEKIWIKSNIIEKKNSSKAQKNGKNVFFRCKICYKKYSTKQGVFQHVLTFHWRKKFKNIFNTKNSMNSYLSSEEIQFIEENSSSTGKRLKKGKCLLCNLNFTKYERCKEHMVVKHLNKTRSEFNFEAMKGMLCKKGKLKRGQYQCVICRDNENPIVFANRKKVLEHISLHTKEDLKAYAKDENRTLVPPDDKTFDHTVMQIKNEDIFL